MTGYKLRKCQDWTETSQSLAKRRTYKTQLWHWAAKEQTRKSYQYTASSNPTNNPKCVSTHYCKLWSARSNNPKWIDSRSLPPFTNFHKRSCTSTVTWPHFMSNAKSTSISSVTKNSANKSTWKSRLLENSTLKRSSISQWTFMKIKRSRKRAWGTLSSFMRKKSWFSWYRFWSWFIMAMNTPKLWWASGSTNPMTLSLKGRNSAR